jgi:hypothetical protein
MVNTYGLCAFTKALLEILIFNQVDKKEYFYVQKEFFQQVIKKEYEYDFPTKFEEWNYNLESHNEAQLIIPSN